jgi:hypothetical protein
MKKKIIFLITLLLFSFSNVNAKTTNLSIKDLKEKIVKIVKEKQEKEILQKKINLNELLGIIIENSSPSRKNLNGLNQAKIVYETLAEGGITRFLALFEKDNLPKKIGPIRSLRDYFLDWIEALEINIFHCGGSDSVLNRLKNSQIKNFDADQINKYFVRNEKIKRPHNLFLETKDIKSKFKKPYSLFEFRKRNNRFTNKHQSVNINFSYNPYNVTYKYDKTLKKYLRFHGKTPHLDNKKQIKVDNIIIKLVESKIIDKKLHLEIKQDKGKCIYLSQGTHTNCTYQKINGKTQYLYDFYWKKTPIRFNPGKLWIEVLDKSKTYVLD